MPLLPIVSIVGRPNVGKSCLFNRILGKRVAVVDDFSVVTRDRNYRNTIWNNCAFSLVDTGGLVPASKDTMAQDIEKQVAIACTEADAILFLVDAKNGVTGTDLAIAHRLRRMERGRVFLVINKSESRQVQFDLGSFMQLGLGEGHAVSALHGYGVGDLLDAVCKLLKRTAGKRAKPDNMPDEEGMLRVAVVGRPNAGKSSLVNKLIGSDRMIVRPDPGTTRDSIDSSMEYKGAKIALIDTAGLRKKGTVGHDIEYYCNLRAIASIERCQIAVLLIDAPNGLGEQDLKIVKQIVDMKKGMLVCFNKWDLQTKTHTTFDHLVADTRREYMEFHHVPMLSISAKTGQRVTSVLDRVLEIHKRMTTRIDEKELWALMRGWIEVHPHPITTNKRVVISGCRQGQAPYPLFLIHSTNPRIAIPSYKRYFANKIYETYDFDGCPVIVEFVPAQRRMTIGKGQGDPSVFLKGEDVS
jgi:GTP-binding protein